MKSDQGLLGNGSEFPLASAGPTSQSCAAVQRLATLRGCLSQTVVTTGGCMPRSLLGKFAFRLLLATVLLGSMLASYGAVTVWRDRRQRPPATVTDVPAAAVNPFASANGTHLVAFLITGSDCGWAKQANMLQIGRTLRTRMRAVHGSSYAAVNVVGVAMDVDVDTGVEFLAQLGGGSTSSAFDQVVVGGSWLNEQIVGLVWREGVAEAASPQIVVIERAVNTESYLSTSTIVVGSDRIVANPVGNVEIMSWVSQQMPLGRSQGPGAEQSK